MKLFKKPVEMADLEHLPVHNIKHPALRIKLFMFLHVCVTPHFFQFVEFTRFGQHHMHHDINVVYKHPLRSLMTFMVIGRFFSCRPHMVFHKISNGFYLSSTACFTNDKKISNSFGNFPEIERYDMATFFSWIAWIIALKILEFLVNLATLLRLRRVANIDNCSNNLNVLNGQIDILNSRKCFVRILLPVLPAHYAFPSL